MPQKKAETSQLNRVLNIRKHLKHFGETPHKYWEIPQKYLSAKKRTRLIKKRKPLKILGFEGFPFFYRNHGNNSKKSTFEGFPLFFQAFPW